MKISSIKKNIFIIVSLALLQFMVVTDILEDIQDKKSLFHMLFESITLVMGFISVFSLILSLRKKLGLAEANFINAKNEVKMLQKEKEEWETKNLKYIEGLSQSIKGKLDSWKLTPSEKEIALFSLKGLSTKEISDIRSTSEITIRQQLSSIYSKSGLRGKNELISFFLEDLLEF